MPIKKQEFYEGAALHVLARAGSLSSVRYRPPLFHLNERLFVLLKYSTKGRSPWAFTFTPEEQALLPRLPNAEETVIGLVCGSDGIVAITYSMFLLIASRRSTALHVGCFRDHGKHYELRGPDGRLPTKIAPSAWRTILD